MFEAGRLVMRVALDGAQTVTRDLGQIRGEFGRLDSDGRRASTEVGQGLLGVGATITGLAAVAVAKFASFDKAFSQVRANVQGSPEDFRKLQQAAIEAGQSTVYTAEEAAQAQSELAKAGVETSNILGGGLSGSLALAAAGQIDVAEAAETAATAMTQFKLSGKDVPHLADLLAAGANKAQGGVRDLGYALKQSGLVASQMGLSVEESIGTLTAFASAGLLGSDAGTSFRTMLLSLANPSAESAGLMKELGINAYDATGKFVGMESVAGQLRKAFENKTQAERDSALATIFGSDAIRAASVLYAQGSEGIRKWTAAVDDQGAAARQAAELQNNLAGDVEKLGGALDSLFILMGSGANGPLRELVQGITSVAEWFGSLTPEVQQTALVLGLVVGGIALATGALLVAVPKVIEYRLAWQTLSTQLPAVAGRLSTVASVLGGPLGIALAAAGAAVMYFVGLQRDMEESAKAIADTLDEQTGAMTANTRATVAKKLADEGAYEVAKKSGVGTKELTDAVLQGGKAWDAVQDKIRGYTNGAGLFDITAANQRDSLNRLEAATRASSDQWERAEQANKDTSEALEGTSAQSEETGTAMDEMSGYVQDAAEMMQQLFDVTRDYNGMNMSAAEGAIAYEKSLSDVAARLDDIANGVEGATNGLNANADGFDRSTEAGRENESLLLDLAKAGQDAADANLAAGGSAEDYRNQLIASRDAWIEQATRFGLSREAAERLAEQIYRIPSQKDIQVIAQTQAAQDAIVRLKGVVDSLTGKTIMMNVAMPGTNKVGVLADGGVRSFAGGGTHENHVAQIARAGEWRVWAEDETGGEAYIPLAPGKRGRSTMILADVADRFGYELVPSGARRMADGGIDEGGSGFPSMNVSFAGAKINADADEVVRKLETAQRKAIMRAGLRRVGVK